jgi:hypothetical protein
MSKNRFSLTRRRLLEGITAGVVAGVPKGMAQGRAVHIPMDYTPKLDRHDVYVFMDGTDTHWEEPRISYRSPFEERDVNNRKPIGVIATLPNDAFPEGALPGGNKLSIKWAVREEYALTKGGQVIGHLNVTVVKEQQVTMEIKRVILVREKTDPGIAARIEKLFTDYDFANDGAPIDYARAKMVADPSIKPDMFEIAFTFSLDKLGSLVEDVRQRTAMMETLDGKRMGVVHTDPTVAASNPVHEQPLGNSEEHPGYFKVNDLHFQRLQSMVIDNPPNADTPEDPVHQVKADPSNASKVIDKIIDTESRKSECGFAFHKNEWPLMTLLVWPEVKFAFKDVDIYIGCGVHIVLRLPWVYFRTSRLDLWVYCRVPDSIVPDIESVLTTCLWHSALSPAVLAVALFDLPAGLGIFLGLFADCVIEKFGKTFACLIPGLALITAVNPPDWP